MGSQKNQLNSNQRGMKYDFLHTVLHIDNRHSFMISHKKESKLRQ